MKATFKRWVIGKVNPASGKVDGFVGPVKSGYTPRPDCAVVYSERHLAAHDVELAGAECEVVLEATVTVEVEV